MVHIIHINKGLLIIFPSKLYIYNTLRKTKET